MNKPGEDRFVFNAKNLATSLETLGLTEIDNATKRDAA